MSKPLYSRDLPGYLQKRQGKLSNTAFAASLGISRQYLALINSGSYIPTPRCLKGMNLEVVLRIQSSGRLIALGDLGKHLEARQGKKTEVEFAAEVGLTRQHFHQIKAGLTAMPAAWAIEKLGMEITYREVKKAKR